MARAKLAPPADRGQPSAGRPGKLAGRLPGAAPQATAGNNLLEAVVELDRTPQPGLPRTAAPGEPSPEPSQAAHEPPSGRHRHDRHGNQHHHAQQPCHDTASVPCGQVGPQARHKFFPPAGTEQFADEVLRRPENRLVDRLALLGAIHVHDVFVPIALQAVPVPLPGTPQGALSSLRAHFRWRGVQSQPAAMRPVNPLAPPQRRRNLIVFEKGLDPGVGVQLADLVALLVLVPLVAAITQHDPRRYPLAAEHQGQGRGKILAVPAGMVGNEVLDGIDRRVPLRPLQGVLELAGAGKLPLETAGDFVTLVQWQAAFPQPACGQGRQAGRRPGIAGHLQIGRYADLAAYGHQRGLAPIDQPAGNHFIRGIVTARFPAPTELRRQPAAVLIVVQFVADGFHQRPDVKEIVTIQVGFHGNLLHHGRTKAEYGAGLRGPADATLHDARPGIKTVGRVIRRWIASPMVLRVPGDHGAPQIDRVLAHGIDMPVGRVYQLQLHDFLRAFQGIAQPSQRDLIGKADDRDGFPGVSAPGRKLRTRHRREDDRRQEQCAETDKRQTGKQFADHSRSAGAGRLAAEPRVHGGQRPAWGKQGGL